MKNLQIYFQILQKNWWLVVLTTLAALTASLAVSYFSTPLYRTSALFIVSPSEAFIANEANLDVVRSIEALDKRSIISTYAEIMNSKRVYDDTSAELSREDLSEYTINAVVLPDSSALELTVEGPDPVTAVQLVNTLGENATSYIQALYQVYDIILLDAATPPRRPFSPTPTRDAGVAVVLGLIVGTGLAFTNGFFMPLVQTWLQETTLQNRKKRLEERLAQVQTNNFALGIIQLKNVNGLAKKLPYSERQHILRQAETAIQQKLPDHTLVEQWDDSSFAILLPDTTASEAQNIFQSLQDDLSEAQALYQENQKQLRLNVAIGLANYQDGWPLSQLIDQAEEALRANYRSETNSTISYARPVGA